MVSRNAILGFSNRASTPYIFFKVQSVVERCRSPWQESMSCFASGEKEISTVGSWLLIFLRDSFSFSSSFVFNAKTAFFIRGGGKFIGLILTTFFGELKV